MAESLNPSASTNPFGSTAMEEQGAPRRNCPSPHNPFIPLPRAASPGNPFAPSVAPSANLDEVLPFGGVCEPMQPIKLDDMFPDFATDCHQVTTSKRTSDVATKYGGPSDLPQGYTSETQNGNLGNHVSDGSNWVNNTNNSNRADVTVEDVAFVDGFGDDFGSLSHTDVIFKTGFMDSNFKAVAVTAEEDDLWSSSFIMEDPLANGETLQSSGDPESTNQGAETCTNSKDQLEMQFHSFHASGTGPDVGEHRSEFPNTKVHIEVDFLPDLPEGPWHPLSQEDTKVQRFAKDQSVSNQVPDPWTSKDLTFEHSQQIQNSQAADVDDLFSRGGSDPWKDAKTDAAKEMEHSQDNGFGQDPWTPCKNSKQGDDQKLAKPETLDLSFSLCNPFSSKDSVGTTLQNPSSPFQDDPSSPFHPEYDPTLHRSQPSSFPFPGPSQLQGDSSSSHSDPWSPSPTPGNLYDNHSQGSSAFHSQNALTTLNANTNLPQFPGSTQHQEGTHGTLNNPWSPSISSANQERDVSGRSRSPNPFVPVEDTANPFLRDLDPLPGKLERMNQRQVSACLFHYKY